MSKKFFCILFILLILSSSVVYAGEYDIMPLADDGEDGETFRDVQYVGFDDSSTTHSVTYRLFNGGGKQEGSFTIPDEMYQSKYWVLFVDSSNNVYFLKPEIDDSRTRFDIWPNGASKFDCWYYRETYEKTYTSIWNADTQSWSEFTLSKGTNLTFSNADISPNSFLYTHNVPVYYRNSTWGTAYTYDNFIDYRVLRNPSLVYSNGGSDSYFRYWQGDFHTDYYSNDYYELTSSINKIYFYAIDLSTNQYVYDGLVISDKIEEFSQDGNYYFDVNLDGLLPQLTFKSGNYLISFATIMNSNKHSTWATALTSSNFYFNTLYTTIGYWRFQYNASTKTGTLVPTDSEGNPTNPGGGEDNPTPEEDPNKGVIDGLGNVQNSIDKQTEAIEEQTEVNKNIFQQLLDLPRQAYSNVLRFA